MKKNIQISKSDLNKILREEYTDMLKKFNRKKELEYQIKQINEELETLPDAEEETIDEVEAGGEKKVKSTGWTGEKNGDVKYDEKFEKKGTHLKEDDSDEEGDDEIEGNIDNGDDNGDNVVSMDSNLDTVEVELDDNDDVEGKFEKMLSDLGKELDKMDGSSVDDVDVDDVDGIESVSGVEDVDSTVDSFSSDEGDDEDDDIPMSEDAEKTIDGKSVSQDQNARFNDQMDKDNHVNESVSSKKGLLKESVILVEGLNDTEVSQLEANLKRMRTLSKLS